VNTQTQTPPQGQTQTQDLTKDIRLIRETVKGKILRICYEGKRRYTEWANMGSKMFDIFYNIETLGNKAKILDEVKVGCLDSGLDNGVVIEA
jgi:hypothetical protein